MMKKQILKETHKQGKPYNLVGLKFGALSVLRDTGKRYHRQIVWECVCDCGNKRETRTSNLVHLSVTHCTECVKKIRSERYRLIANQMNNKRKRNRVYSIWRFMKDRCGLVKHGRGRSNYAGRGITVCDEWKDDFHCFETWAKDNGYSEDKTIERIDVNGNYCPGNCRWVSFREQSYNKTNSLYIGYHNKKISLAKMIYDLGLNGKEIYHYLNSSMAQEIFVSEATDPE